MDRELQSLCLQVRSRLDGNSGQFRAQQICDALQDYSCQPNVMPTDFDERIVELKKIGEAHKVDLAGICLQMRSRVQETVRLTGAEVTFGDLAYIFAHAKRDTVNYKEVKVMLLRVVPDGGRMEGMASRVREELYDSLIRRYQRALFRYEGSDNVALRDQLETRVVEHRAELADFESTFGSHAAEEFRAWAQSVRDSITQLERAVTELLDREKKEIVVDEQSDTQSGEQ